MKYISKYRPPKKAQTVQTKEQHVTNKLSKCQLNPTINELENLILQKLCRLEKHQWRLHLESGAQCLETRGPAPGGRKPIPRSPKLKTQRLEVVSQCPTLYIAQKYEKENVFMNKAHVSHIPSIQHMHTTYQTSIIIFA